MPCINQSFEGQSICLIKPTLMLTFSKQIITENVPAISQSQKRHAIRLSEKIVRISMSQKCIRCHDSLTAPPTQLRVQSCL